MPRILVSCAALACLLGSGAAWSQDANALNRQALAATCANCHGTQGRTVDAAVVPALAGLPAPYLAEQMRAFKSGTRGSTVMQQLAKGFSDAQIDALAAYFAAQKK